MVSGLCNTIQEWIDISMGPGFDETTVMYFLVDPEAILASLRFIRAAFIGIINITCP